MKHRVMLVDDEPAVLEALARALTLEGYRVETAVDGAEALKSLSTSAPDAIVLDILMPPPDGLEVCRRLRRAGDRTPILMLTARDEVGDRVEGLDAGADDYLAKPFALAELLARLRALLRRAGPEDRGILRYEDLTLDPNTYEVVRGSRAIVLTRTEFALLHLFMKHPRQVLPRASILERVWGYDFSETSHTLEVYIGYLRRKLEAEGEPRLIHTLRGIGYVFRTEPS